MRSRKTRKTVAMLMALAMVLGLTACNKQANTETAETEEPTAVENTEAETEAPSPALATSISVVEIGYGNAVILKDSTEPDEVETVAETATETETVEGTAEEAAEETEADVTICALPEAAEEEEAAEERELTPVTVTVTAENVTAWTFEVSEVESGEEETAAEETEEDLAGETAGETAEETAEETEAAAADDAEEDFAPVPAFVVEGFKINFNIPGEYVITITAAGEDGTEVSVDVDVTVVDDVAPVITAPESLEVTVGDEDFDFLSGVSAYDEIDGDLTEAVTVDTSDTVLDEAGETMVKYQVKDAAGNAAEIEVPVTVTTKATVSTGNNQGNQSSSGSGSSGGSGSGSSSSNGEPTLEEMLEWTDEQWAAYFTYDYFVDDFNKHDVNNWDVLWEALDSDLQHYLTEEEYYQLKAYVDAGIAESGGSSGNSGYVSNEGSASNETTAAVDVSEYKDDMAREAFDIMNQYRADAGLDALVWNDTLYEAAKIRAQELVTSFSHTRPDGSSYSTVLAEVGWPYNLGSAENAAMGQTSAQDVMTSWYNSDGHRRNMLNSYTNAAVGCYYENGTYYWITLFSSVE